jgi:outer membrane protein assembly factor BamB
MTNLSFPKLGLLPALMLLLVLASAACAGVAKSEGWSGGVVVDDILYTGSMDGTLLAVEIATGDPVWEFSSLQGEQRERAFYGDPVVVDEVVYAAAYNGFLYAISNEDGSKMWETQVGPGAEQLVGGPGYSDGVLVVGSSDGSVYAFDSESGTELWNFPTDSMVWTTPLVSDGVVYFGSMDKYVYAVSLSEGQEIWKTLLGGAVIAPPAKSDNRLFVGAFDGVFYSLDASTGAELWRFEDAGGWYWARALVTETAVYAPSLDGRIYALTPELGELIWQGPENPDGPIIGSPAAVKNVLVFASEGGTLWTASLADGTKQRQCEIDENLKTNVVAADDSIFLGAWDHTVRAFEMNQFGVLNTRWVYKTDREMSENPVNDVSSC